MSQKGFVTVAMLTFLPLLAAALAVIAASFLVMKADGASKHACRVEVLRAQQSASKTLRELMALNSKAASLRSRRQAAEAEVAMGDAPAVLALQAILIQQSALAAEQRVLLTKGKLVSASGPELALGRARATLQTAASNVDKSALAVAGHARPGKFDVIATPPGDLTPSYLPSSSFRDHQEMKVDWSFDVTSLLPGWIGKILGQDHLKMSGECSATLEKGASKWEPRITMARSSSSL